MRNKNTRDEDVAARMLDEMQDEERERDRERKLAQLGRRVLEILRQPTDCRGRTLGEINTDAIHAVQVAARTLGLLPEVPK